MNTNPTAISRKRKEKKGWGVVIFFNVAYVYEGW
jgi:hypothetical protein